MRVPDEQMTGESFRNRMQHYKDLLKKSFMCMPQDYSALDDHHDDVILMAAISKWNTNGKQYDTLLKDFKERKPILQNVRALFSGLNNILRDVPIPFQCATWVSFSFKSTNAARMRKIRNVLIPQWNQEQESLCKAFEHTDHLTGLISSVELYRSKLKAICDLDISSIDFDKKFDDLKQEMISINDNQIRACYLKMEPLLHNFYRNRERYMREICKTATWYVWRRPNTKKLIKLDTMP